MKLMVVVAKYRESINWTKEINKPVIVFNKNPEEASLFEFNLPNRGRETDTFLNYIIDHYENLPEFVVFLQGNPFDHCQKVVDIINGFKFDEDFKPLGSTYFRDGGLLKQTLDWASFCEIDIISPPKFISGMQCIVSKEVIRKRSKESYTKIHEKVSKEINYNSHTGYYFEYLWPTILGFNEELKVGCGC